MKFFVSHITCGYVDADGIADIYYIFDSDVQELTIRNILMDDAWNFFDDHTYLSPDYDGLYDGFFSDEEEAQYYDNCDWSYKQISLDAFLEEFKNNPDIKIHDHREKEKVIKWH